MPELPTYSPCSSGMASGRSRINSSIGTINDPPRRLHWLADLPLWLEVRAVASFADATLLRLDVGEREAIQLALEPGVRTVLIDEADGRKAAERLHLEVRGTLGILERGAKLGKISFRQALRKLEQTSFRVSPAVREAFWKETNK